MEKVIWDRSYNVGNELIDRQHQYLVNLINLLIENKTVLSMEELNAIFNNLVHYANVHFHDEEEIISKTNYPNKISHKKEHRIFVKELEKIKFEIIIKDSNAVDSMLEFLSQWLINHILISDKEFVQYL